MTVNALNAFLGNIGKTIDLARPSLQRSGDDAAMAGLVEEMNRGEGHTLILYGMNPAYDYPHAQEFLQSLGKVTLSVSFPTPPHQTPPPLHPLLPPPTSPPRSA